MIEFLEQIDFSLLKWINSHNYPALDQLMWYISGKYTAIPLYLFLLYLLIKAKGKTWWRYAIAIGVLIALCDQSSVHLFKDVFQRYRPCHHSEIQDWIHLVNNKCGGKYGFVSSHAANVFGLVTFLFIALKNKLGKNISFLFFWACLVAYSRVYLGVHYPSDVLGGAILGGSLAILVHGLLNFINNKIND